jgi:hypothetical protein
MAKPTTWNWSSCGGIAGHTPTQPGVFCDNEALERPRYYARQLMTPGEMTLEQRFFLNKMRRHNRLLHGWGIVCGLRVKQLTRAGNEPVPWTVEIESGYALDPAGNEIVVSDRVIHDLRLQGAQDRRPGSTGADPWCTDVTPDREPGQPIYIAVCYHECEVRPVRVPPNGCGCDESSCENSRIQEAFVIRTLPELPRSYAGLESLPPLSDFLVCTAPGVCPPCPEELCVILATVTPDREGILSIDCYTHRRYVVSLADYYVLCQTEDEAEFREQTMERLSLLLNARGVQDLAGDPAAALTLPSVDLFGLAHNTDQGRALRTLTIGEIADMSHEEWTRELEERGIPDMMTPSGYERWARHIWLRAREVRTVLGARARG